MYVCGDFQEKIQHVDSKVAVLSAKVDEFARSHITADEMQGQVHEMREDLDHLKAQVDKLKQNVKSQMVGVLIACNQTPQHFLQAMSLRDIQDSLDELEKTITTFRQEINSRMSRKSGRCSLYLLITCSNSAYDTALLKAHIQLGENSMSNTAAWKATYEGRVNILELELSWMKGRLTHFNDFHNTVCDDVTQLQQAMEELRLECTPNHSNFTEGMELLFSLLQDKIEDLGKKMTETQMVAPLQDELYVGDLSFHFIIIHDHCIGNYAGNRNYANDGNWKAGSEPFR